MKRLFARAGFTVLILTLASAPRIAAAPHRAQLLVDDDKVECPNAGFTKIQDAVNAATPGTEIRVCPGTYNEQVTINKTLRIVGDNGVVVMPTGTVQNTTSLATGNPIAAVILVMGADGVVIKNLTVDGANNNIGGCAPDLIGVFYRNASGKVEDVAVRNVRLGAGLEGCQSGLGVFVQSGNGNLSRVEVVGSSVHDFQKNGITGNEAGTEVLFKGNVVTGIGPTSGAAQNGIQIGFGARGEIEGNAVANHIWSPCVSVQACAFTATNILVFESNDVSIERNLSGISQIGIALEGNHSEVEHNTVFDTRVFDGIAVMGDRNEIEDNSITHSAESGIFLQGNNNEVSENRINEAPIGILKASGSIGNVISGNRFFNTPITVKDPASPATLNNLSPYR